MTVWNLSFLDTVDVFPAADHGVPYGAVNVFSLRFIDEIF